MDDYEDLMAYRGPKNAYGLFCEVIEKEDEKNNIKIDFNEQSNKCWKKWQTMTDKEKRPFRVLAGEDYYITNMFKANGKKILYGPFPPMPDFHWFCKDERPKIESEKPDYTVAEIVEEIEKRWNECSLEDKKKYKDIAKSDKERFEDDLEKCESQHFTDEECESNHSENEEYKLKQTLKNHSKIDYESKLPRSTRDAFGFFIDSALDEFEKNNPKSNNYISEVINDCRKKWESMENEEKKPFQILADKDEKRYKKEKIKYEKSFYCSKDPNSPKRPFSNFYYFCQKKRPKVTLKHQNSSVKKINKKLKKRWNKLSPDKKKKYDLLVDEDEKRYANELEIYKKSRRIYLENKNFFYDSESST